MNKLHRHHQSSIFTDRSDPTEAGRMSAAAICIQSKVSAQSKAYVEICLAWYMPLVSFLTYTLSPLIMQFSKCNVSVFLFFFSSKS